MSMNYFFTQVLFKADGTFDRSTTGYDAQDEAEKAFHQGMASAIGNASYSKAIMFVFDFNGEIKFRRIWNRV